jgi:hypothetical protein
LCGFAVAKKKEKHMTADRHLASGLTSPPLRAFSILPDDQTDLVRPIRGLMVAIAGDVSVVTEAGDEVVLPGLLPGIQYAIRARRIRATGTNADGLVGLA